MKGFILVTKTAKDYQIEYKSFQTELQELVKPYIQKYCDYLKASYVSKQDITVEQLVKILGKRRYKIEITKMGNNIGKFQLSQDQQNMISMLNGMENKDMLQIQFKIGNAEYNIYNEPLALCSFYRNITRTNQQFSKELLQDEFRN